MNDDAEDSRPDATTSLRRRHDPRRERTRRKLLDAGRTVFERDGFHLARLSDVTAEAGVSTGTFYHHFTSKSELFSSLIDEVVEELVQVDGQQRPDGRDPVAGIFEANRAYVNGYRRNARLMTLLVQLGPHDEEISAKGRNVRSEFETRLTRAIERWQAEGLAYCDLDARCAANAFAYLVDRFLYEWAVLDLDDDEERVADELTKLWVRGLGMQDGPRKTQRAKET